MSSINVSDHRSNANEQIEFAVQKIGRSVDRRKVFEEVYRGSKPVKTVLEIATKANISPKRVLEEGKKLAGNSVIVQTKVGKQTAYRKDTFYAAHKIKILALVKSPIGLKKLVTKRNPILSIHVETIKVPKNLHKIKQLFIDDIDSFKIPKKTKVNDIDLKMISENAFKEGIQKIIGEKGKFTDWGGEVNDLLTTRVIYKGKRIQTAFAFKGPGKRGKLTPAKMGRNGDQIQRLFKSPAELFILQYWAEIDISVIEQVEAFAKLKSISAIQNIFYCIMDGQDTQRLVDHYPSYFKTNKNKKS